MSGGGSLSERLAAVSAGRAARARFDWGAVTLRDFAALRVLRDARGLEALDAYWRARWVEAEPVRADGERDGEPDGFTVGGLELFAGWRAAVAAESVDPAGAVFAARELLGTVGFFAVMGAERWLDGRRGAALLSGRPV